MQPEQFEAGNRLADQVEELLDSSIESGKLDELKALIRDAASRIGRDRFIELSIVLDVIDPENERSLRILNTGVATNENGETHRISSDASAHRYVVDGELATVPHDQCPKCWQDWLFKFEHPACPHCDAELGKNVKVLLDSDVCPHCESGTLSLQDPVCSRCGFSVEPAWVSWG